MEDSLSYLDNLLSEVKRKLKDAKTLLEYWLSSPPQA